jgi:hypothetical protein
MKDVSKVHLRRFTSQHLRSAPCVLPKTPTRPRRKWSAMMSGIVCKIITRTQETMRPHGDPLSRRCWPVPRAVPSSVALQSSKGRGVTSQAFEAEAPKPEGVGRHSEGEGEDDNQQTHTVSWSRPFSSARPWQFRSWRWWTSGSGNRGGDEVSFSSVQLSRRRRKLRGNHGTYCTARGLVSSSFWI